MATAGGGVHAGMDRLHKSFVEHKKSSGCSLTRMSRSELGLFFFAHVDTGSKDLPHSIVLGFVPNEDADDIGAAVGRYHRISFLLDHTGGISDVKPEGLDAHSQALIGFAKDNFGPAIRRHAERSLRLGGCEADAAQVFLDFLDKG
jgi:hypothetical protein